MIATNYIYSSFPFSFCRRGVISLILRCRVSQLLIVLSCWRAWCVFRASCLCRCAVYLGIDCCGHRSVAVEWGSRRLFTSRLEPFCTSTFISCFALVRIKPRWLAFSARLKDQTGLPYKVIYLTRLNASFPATI